MTPETYYLIAAASAVAAGCAIPPLWRWCAGVDKPKPSDLGDLGRLRPDWRLNMWRNRAANAKAALALELKRKRGGIGQARKAYEDAVSQVLRLENAHLGEAAEGRLEMSPDAMRQYRALQTAAVTSSPSDPD